MQFKINERFFSIVIVLMGIIVAMILTPKDRFFLANFLLAWIPQGIIIGLLIATKMNTNIIIGCAFIMTLYFTAYPYTLIYLISIPGAFIGAFIIGISIKKYSIQSSIFVIFVASLGTLIGIGIIHFCNIH